MARIELNDITFCYEGHNGVRTVLDHVSLAVEDGEFVCLVGRSGCGKTTLLRLITGLQSPASGQILLDGKPITGPGTDRAVVFQNYALFPWMTARKNVEFGIRQANRTLSRSEIRERALDFLEKVSMSDAADQFPCELSGGMRQRVAIARALAMDTDILLLDEPFGALDARIRKELQLLLEQLWQSGERRKTVIFVTHDIAEAALLADRVIYMTPGRIAADIPVSLPHPRDAISDGEAKAMSDLRTELLQLFYQNSGLEDDHEEV
ncbi:MAG: ABC transporter ATP-binding protein [Oscillospiraceae bacterium]|nr:ABC transporter ATP-binding protein [Oscillospiraceae bacterium]